MSRREKLLSEWADYYNTDIFPCVQVLILLCTWRCCLQALQNLMENFFVIELSKNGNNDFTQNSPQFSTSLLQC